MVSGHDARHRCRTGLFLQSLSIPQVLSPREDLFCLSLHSGSKLKGSLREIRIWVHRFTSLFRPSRRVRRLVAIDETVLKVNGQTCYLLNCNCSTI